MFGVRRYFLTYLVPGMVLVGSALILVGSPWLGVTLPLLVIYLLTPGLNALRNRQPRHHAPSTVTARQRNALLLPALPMQLVVLGFAIYAASLLPNPGLIFVWILSTGICSALFAVNVAHELMHSRHTRDRWLATGLLAAVCFPTFLGVHLAVHHRYVGTERDFQSAQLGQSLYRFWFGALVGHVRYFVETVTATTRARHQILVCAMVVVSFVLVCATLGGWLAVGFFLAQGLVAILKLEAVNYLQHYGLARGVDGHGRIERVKHCHAWSQSSSLTNWALLNLMHHADHHVHPDREFFALCEESDSPQYPMDFSLMFIVAAIPSLFRAIVHPRLGRGEIQPTATARPQDGVGV
ncbi:MAG: alkane 1-monooxygenase [Gammaproteobacteria bacterium]|nr:alkane 1-monooxygenase [Gammaproteobacteria bacterium]